MSTKLEPTTPRMSAGERREQLLEAAVAEFALHGLNGTSTEVIARRVGVSQPYLFRLFGTKKDLFLAAVQRGFDRTQETFQRAAEAHPDRKLEAMGEAYIRLVSNREELLMQMQAYAACGDPEVQVIVRERFSGLIADVKAMTGAGDHEVMNFFRSGMFLNVATAMDLLSIQDEKWARLCLEDQP
jgi:AcrR family transcriptional regulator